MSMSIPKRFAILVDASFLKWKLYAEINSNRGRGERRHITCPDIVRKIKSIGEKRELREHELFRVFYYDAPPGEGQFVNPLSSKSINYANTETSARNTQILSEIGLERNFAVRKGSVKYRGWVVPNNKVGEVVKRHQPIIRDDDLKPDFQQKGVDMKIGLDIASLSAKHVVDILVLVTGDADFIPAMKLARREGLLVYLEALGHGVNDMLKVHADVVI